MSVCRFSLPILRNTRPQPGCRHACSTVSDAAALVGDALISLLLLLLLLSLLLEDDMDERVLRVCADGDAVFPRVAAVMTEAAPPRRPGGAREKWRRVYFFHLFSFHQFDANEKMSVRHLPQPQLSEQIV
jgi:hypothetical protein